LSGTAQAACLLDSELPDFFCSILPLLSFFSSTSLPPFFVLFALVLSQPPARIPKNGAQVTSTIPNWSCTFEFLYNNETIFTETLNPDTTNVERDNFFFGEDNDIDAISWSGTSCFCWVLLYQNDDFEDYRTGLWVGSTSGTFDLTEFLVEDSDDSASDSDDITDDDTWYQWDKALSSYRIYCY